MENTARMILRQMTIRRWVAIGVLVLVALLYYRPLTAYMHAKADLGQRRVVVSRLEREQANLKQRLGSSTSVGTLAREARALGYVRKGEHLFIVKDIDAWRKRLRASLQPHGR
ncbi:MAG TPA: septum formation initiator family protein [Gaiellaceae bacterium]